MTDQVTNTEVRQQVNVRAGRARAFAVFTEMFATWWPMEHHIGITDPQTVIIEGSVGGRWYERSADGTECDWGRVTAWEPPERLVLAWHLDPDFVYDPDPAKATEVEVTFTAEADGTAVVLVHRGFEVHGVELAARLASGVGADAGWPMIMQRYAAAAT